MSLNAISLFSGMGGDTLGLENAGVSVVAYSEYIDIFDKTHKLNFPDSIRIGQGVKSNILEISDEEFLEYSDAIDIVFAGFPCQSFSQGGARKVNDPRNTMFREFARAVSLISPDIAIGENVKGLLTKKTENGELYIDIIVQTFQELGYDVNTCVLSAHKYGISQQRDRLFIVCIKMTALDKYSFKIPEPINVNPSLVDIVAFSMVGAVSMDTDVFDFGTIPSECVLTDLSNSDTENNPHPYLKLKRDGDKSYQGKTYNTLFSFGKRASPIHIEIVDIRKPTKTIICTYGRQPRLVVPLRNKNGYFVRMFTVDELKQIQGFPADYKMLGSDMNKITMVGNAVPPPLVTNLVNALID